MAFSQTYKEGLYVQLENVEEVEERQVYLWKNDLQKLLNSNGVKFVKFFAGKKIQRILDIAEKLVRLIAFIQAIGGWESFKTIILKIIELGGVEETIQKLEPTNKLEKKQ